MDEKIDYLGHFLGALKKKTAPEHIQKRFSVEVVGLVGGGFILCGSLVRWLEPSLLNEALAERRGLDRYYEQ